MENLPQASKWFNILLARVPTDPGILSRMGHIANKEDDDSQAYFYHKERYAARLSIILPSNQNFCEGNSGFGCAPFRPKRGYGHRSSLAIDDTLNATVLQLR